MKTLMYLTATPLLKRATVELDAARERGAQAFADCISRRANPETSIKRALAWTEGWDAASAADSLKAFGL
jgi:hypothetical protein